MRLFVYRRDYFVNTWSGCIGAPHGPGHEEVLVIAESREKADQILCEGLRRYRKSRTNDPAEHEKFCWSPVPAVVALLEDPRRDGYGTLTVTEHDLQEAFVLGIK